MIKRIKAFLPEAIINSEEFRLYVENFESEITRGISTLSIISIICRNVPEGIYGYQLLKDLEAITGNILIIEEGTLYPILKKLERDGIVKSEKKLFSGRPRNYYMITERGILLYNHIMGYFTKLVKGLSPLMAIEIKIPEIKGGILYCPNCANRIDLKKNMKFCNICGLNIEEIQRRI